MKGSSFAISSSFSESNFPDFTHNDNKYKANSMNKDDLLFTEIFTTTPILNSKKDNLIPKNRFSCRKEFPAQPSITKDFILS